MSDPDHTVAARSAAGAMTGTLTSCQYSHRVCVLAAFLGGLALYTATCAPGVLWQDSAMFQQRALTFDLRGDSGLPLAHPLYILLARGFTALLPLGDRAWRVNMFSALCGATAMAFIMRLLLHLTQSRLAAFLGTVSLAVSHTFWTHSVMAEVYNLYALGLLIELLCIERFFATRRPRWFCWALFTCGLNLSNHLLAILHGPVYLGVLILSMWRRTLSLRHIFLACGAFLLGMTPYTWLIAENVTNGMPLGHALKEALVGPPERAHKVLDLNFLITRQLAKAALYFAMNFPTPILLLAPVALWVAVKQRTHREFTLVSAGLFAIGFLFAFRYPVPDQFVFYTPCYVILAVMIGMGASHLFAMQRSPGANGPSARAIILTLFAVLPVPVYVVAPAVLNHFDLSIGAKRDIPYRDTVRYFVQPWKHGETSAQRFGQSALAQAAPDGLLYADTTIKNVLVYLRDVEGLQRGVTLTTGHDTTPRAPRIDRTPEAVAPFVRAGKAFICSNAPDYVPAWIVSRWDLEPEGDIFRLVDRASAPSPDSAPTSVSP